MRLCSAEWALGVAGALFASATAALDFTLGAGPVDRCKAGGPSVHAAALAYLEPAPVLLADAYGGKHYQPGDGNNVAVGTGYADVVARAGKLCVGVFYRADYRGDVDRDTLDALVANHHKRPFDVGRTYRLRLESAYFDSAGLRLSRVFQFEPADGWSAQLGLTASLMKALTHQDERLDGSAVAVDSRYAVGSASLVRTLTNYDMKDFNPFVAGGDPGGYGYAADAGVVVTSPTGYRIELTVMDAYSRIEWHGVPQSLETVDNETLRYDANFNREAFVNGRDRRLDVGSTIQPRYRTLVAAPLKPGLALVVSDDYVQSTHFPAAGVRGLVRDIRAEVSYDVRTQAVSVNLGKGWLSLSVTSDAIRPGSASVLGATLNFASGW